MTLTARWLGQAGFLIRSGDDQLLIDPYLSDSLAEKYRGRRWPHVRMRPAPLTVDELPDLRAVVCTHAHTDHMDPATLRPLLARQPKARLVCPRAVLAEAVARSGVGGDRIDALADGDRITAGGFTLEAVPSAHETRSLDPAGDDHFLGYVITTADDVRIYHSGDCAPWDGLAGRLQGLGVDVALLPVNGRDSERLSNGVPGNFDFPEAVDLCATAGVATLVPHHWGMFEFNTVDPATFDLDLADRRGVHVVVPEHGRYLDLNEVVS